MAFYDYKCPNCGHVEEKDHGMTETPEYECEKCGTPLKREITGGAATIYRGRGFHTTDTRNWQEWGD